MISVGSSFIVGYCCYLCSLEDSIFRLERGGGDEKGSHWRWSLMPHAHLYIIIWFSRSLLEFLYLSCWNVGTGACVIVFSLMINFSLWENQSSRLDMVAIEIQKGIRAHRTPKSWCRKLFAKICRPFKVWTACAREAIDPSQVVSRSPSG